jgi:hypothetical protein
MSDLLRDLAKKGCKILTDTKTPRKDTPKGKEIPQKAAPQELDVHQAAVKRFCKEKPGKKHLIEFFEKIIDVEENKL